MKRITALLFFTAAVTMGLWASGNSEPESQAGIEQTKPSKNEENLLNLAENGDVSGIEQLLKVDINLDQTDESGRTALHAAAESGDTEIAAILIIRGASVDPLDDRGRTPLNLSVGAGNTGVSAVLSEAGADISKKDSSGSSPASLALRASSNKLSSILTEENINSPAIDGVPMLHAAAHAGLLGHLQVLLEAGADPGLIAADGTRAIDAALSGAVTVDNAQAAAVLIEKGSPAPAADEWDYIYLPFSTGNIESRFDYGSTALHAAAERGHEGMLRYLLDSGADIDARDQPGNTALHIAVRKGYRTIANILLDRGCDVDVRDFNGNAPLHESLTAPDRDAMTQMLLDRGADPNIKNGSGSTPLHLTVLLGSDVSAAELLLNRGALVDPRDRTGNTPLLLAIEATNRDLSELFLAEGADIFAKNNKGLTPVEGALSYGPEVSAWFFLGNRLSQTDNEGRSVLHLAVSLGAVAETVEVLLKAGAEPDLRDFNGESPLHYAIALENIGQSDVLLDFEADPYIENNSGWTPLIMAFDKGHEFTTAFLADRLDIEDRWGGTPLFHAVQWEYPVIVAALLRSGAAVNHANKRGATALHIAVHGESLDIAQLLLDFHANPDAPDTMGRTPLHDAVIWGNYDMTRLLADAGADLDLADITGQRALHMSAFAGNDIITKWLLDTGASPNVRDSDGETPLFIAAESDRSLTAEILLDAGAGIAVRDKKGKTPLHAALAAGRTETARYIISRGGDIFALDAQGITPFHMAMNGGSALLTALLDENLSNKQDNRGYSPLHIAVESSADEEVFRVLLNEGADRKIRNASGQTPSELAVSLGKQELADLLY